MLAFIRAFIATIEAIGFVIVGLCAILLWWFGGLPNGPPPLQKPDPKAIEAARKHGAGSIEELIRFYRTAHLRKDMKEFRQVVFWSLGAMDPETHTYPWYYHVLPDERLMEKVFDIPLKDVQFQPGPGPKDQEYGHSICYYRKLPDGRTSWSWMGGEVYGKLILFTMDGRRLDPGYIVMGGAPGRFNLHIHGPTTEDVLQLYKNPRPPLWLALPMKPANQEELALYNKARGK